LGEEIGAIKMFRRSKKLFWAGTVLLWKWKAFLEEMF